MSEKKPKKVPWASLPTRLGIAVALLLLVFPFAWDATNGNREKRFSPLSQDFDVEAATAKYEAEKAAEAEREKAAKAKGKEKGVSKPNSEPRAEPPKPDSPEPATATDEGGEPTVDPPAPKRQGGNGGKRRKPPADDGKVGGDKDEKDALEAARNAINNI